MIQKTIQKISLERKLRGLTWIALLPALVFATTASAQLGSFDSGSDGSDGALSIRGTFAPLDSFGAVYDGARDQIVGFGGDPFAAASSFADSNRTYVFDGERWKQVSRDSGPSARAYPNLAYDSLRQNVILFGGDGIENDTWTWDGAAWAELAIANPPPNYYSRNAGLDFFPPTGKTVLILRELFASQELVTWTFDGSDWTESAAVLPRRDQFQISYNPTLQRIVLLMRLAQEGMETWLYDGTNWTIVEGESIPRINIDTGELLYDGRTNQTAFYGREGGYVFDGTNWTAVSDFPEIAQNISEEIVYSESLDAIIGINGINNPVTGGTRQVNETWAWYADGSTEQLTDSEYVFDMSARPNGVWEFSTIDIGPNVTVTFKPNATNTPVRWLASGDVTVDGTIDISGVQREVEESETFGNKKDFGGISGPGGFNGATGAPLGISLTVPGDGPGGGLLRPNINNSHDGEIYSYSNAWLHPLIGGSGGSSKTGAAGGAAGGALLIASSGEINVEGSILARPKTQGLQTDPSFGSGGAILLRANKATGSGYIDVNTGRLRIEAWERPLAENMTGSSAFLSAGLPLLPVSTDPNPPRLWIESINGVTITTPRRSANSLVDPDAIIQNHSGDSTIVVKGENVPNGTSISITVTLQDESILEPDAVAFNGTQSTFTLSLPEGFGAIAAKATFPNQD